MTESNEVTVMSSSANPATSSFPPQVISMNTATLIPQKLSTGGNYSMWSSHMTNLLLGYDLMGFVDGTHLCPPTNDPDYKVWIRQGRQLLLAIQTAVAGPAGSILSRCKNAEETWCKLKTTYANKSITRIVGLIDSLTKVSQEGKSIAEFMLSVKTIIDDLALIGHDTSDGKIVVHTLNGLTI
ncbi:GTPase, partial [Actinidia chinensis var. chinensis]